MNDIGGVEDTGGLVRILFRRHCTDATSVGYGSVNVSQLGK